MALNRRLKSYLVTLVNKAIIPQDLLDEIVSTGDINVLNEEGIGLVQYVCFNGNVQSLKTLINHGLDINHIDSDSNSALHVAILNKNKSIIDFLLQSNILKNPLQTNFEEMNALQLAAQRKDASALITLLKDSRFKGSLAHKDIFGRTALDIAANAKWDEGIKLLLNNKHIQPNTIAGYGKTFYDIGQLNLEQKLRRFLDKKGQKALNDVGNCNGWSFLYMVYLTQGREQEYFDILELLIKWNGKKQFLINANNLPGSLRKLYKNPEEVFNQLLNDLAVFHSDSAAIDELQLNIQQRERIKQYDLIKSAASNRSLRHLFGYNRLSLSKAQLIEMLAFMQRWPETVVDIHLPEHAVSLYVTKDRQFKYYNSNAKNKTQPFTCAQSLAEHIIKSFYIKENNLAPGESIDIGFDAYKFYNNPKMTTKNERALKARSQAKASANGFTPLHYAVMENDEQKVINILKSAPQSALTLKDQHGFSPVTRAIMLKSEKIFLALLRSYANKQNAKDVADVSNIKITHCCANDEIAFLAKLAVEGKLNPHLVIDNEGGTILSHALSYGIDVDLQKRLLKAPSVDIHRVDQSQKTILHHAVGNGADSHVIKAITSLKGFNINKQDIHGDTALMIAVMDESKDIVKTLLDSGVDVHVRNKSGQSALDLAILFRNEPIEALLSQKQNEKQKPPLIFSKQRSQQTHYDHKSKNLERKVNRLQGV
uniref:Ankyrin repeats (3 copies) n=1 Tax=Candidatus Berkiella aquae TaxID=295108 RepID=A0A0Q9YJD7_9GAMM